MTKDELQFLRTVGEYLLMSLWGHAIDHKSCIKCKYGEALKKLAEKYDDKGRAKGVAVRRKLRKSA